jgi:endonuclease/exonuclease/phosphatase family metal-dependent hydrolase
MIRVVSWNVLADAYVRREYYPHTPPEVFERSKRRTAVTDRIASFTHAEVICLQEADSSLFALLQERLPDSTGRLCRKRGRGEGCAMFVRHALTTEPEWRELAFSDLSGHVALGVSFAGMSVVTTHLKWQPGGDLSETHYGRSQLAELLDAWPTGPRVVCGDFNAEPASSVLTLAKSRGFADAHAAFTSGYTCLADGERKRIDYVLYTDEFGAKPSPLPSLDDDRALPSETDPSDHVPIEVRLEK